MRWTDPWTGGSWVLCEECRRAHYIPSLEGQKVCPDCGCELDFETERELYG